MFQQLSLKSKWSIVAMLLSLSACKMKSSVKVETNSGASITASEKKIFGTVYNVVKVGSNSALTNKVSDIETPASSSALNIYKVTSSSETPILLTSTTSNTNGNYSQNLRLPSAMTVLIVAKKDNTSIGQALVIVPADAEFSVNINILSTITSALLFKKNIALEQLTSAQLLAFTNMVQTKISENPNMDAATLLTELTASTQLGDVIGSTSANEDRSSSKESSLLSVIPSNGIAHASVTKLDVTQNSTSVAKDSTTTFSAFATYSDGSVVNVTSSAIWTSANDSTATVTKSGSTLTVTGRASGTVDISVKFGGQTVSKSLTITNATLVSINLTPLTPSGPFVTTTQFTATGTYSDASTATITTTATWTSSDQAVATISSTGLATPTGVGTTTITATQESVSKSTVLTVVTQAAPPNPTGQGSSAGSTSSISLTWTSGGGTTTSYKIAYQTGATAPADCTTGTLDTASTNSKTVSGLASGTQYSFRICASNGNASPDLSAGVTTTASTLETVPPNPTGPSATPSSSSEIALSWTSGGVPTASYKIAYQAGATAPANCSSGTTTTSGSNSKAITGLTPSTQYAFRICAVNSNSTPDVSTGVTTTGTTSAISAPTAWSFVDGDQAAGLKKDPAGSAVTPQLTTFNSKLYSTWSEISSGTSQIRVVVYSGNDSSPSWTYVDGGGANGLNKNTSQNATDPQLTTFNSKLYLTWTEGVAGAEQIRMAVYNGNDGSPTWTFVDGNGVNGINKNTAKSAGYPQLTEFNSKLYATWVEVSSSTSQTRVAVYNGNDSSPAWSFVDGNGTNGLNKNPAEVAGYSQLTAYNSKLYLTWSEGSLNQIRVAVYNSNDSAPSWSFVDGNAATGINKDTSKAAYNPQLTVFNSKLYAAWHEDNAALAKAIRVAVFNGNDSSPSWSLVDADSIVKMTNQPATDPQLTVYNSTLYVTWNELTTYTVTRVATYNGNDSSPSWTLMGGGTPLSLNKGNESSTLSQLTVFNSKLYATWSERHGVYLDIRIAVGN